MEIRIGLGPLQRAFAPGIVQAASQEENEENDFQHCEKRYLAVGHGEGKEEDSLHIEDYKHQRKDVVLHLELDPGVAHGLDAAFIGAVLDCIALLRSQDEAVNQDRGARKNCPHEEENSDKQ